MFSFFLRGLEPGEGGGTQTGGGDDGNGIGPAIYAGAAVAGVLLIIGIIVIIVLRRRRKPLSHGNGEMFPHYLTVH